ncbi:MAG: DUF1361 domain-containing protein [Gaiella sp.]
MSDRRAGTVFVLLLASGLCLAGLWLRMRHTGLAGYHFLGWNLFLAWIPFIAALMLVDGHRRGAARVVLLPVGLAWLLFLPNAPYLATDLVHVGRIPGAPIWSDAALVAGFAGTGLVLGLASLLLVQGVVADRLGKTVSWLLPLPVLVLSSVGVVLGRIDRLNSWDAVTDPSRVLDALAGYAADPGSRAVALLLASTVALAVAYLVLVTVSGLVPARSRHRGDG